MILNSKGCCLGCEDETCSCKQGNHFFCKDCSYCFIHCVCNPSIAWQEDHTEPQKTNLVKWIETVDGDVA